MVSFDLIFACKRCLRGANLRADRANVNDKVPSVLPESRLLANIDGMDGVNAIMNLLGGPTAIGRRLGIRPQAVSLWIASERVPVARVPALVRMAREQGVELRPEMLRNDIDWGGLA